MKEQALLMAIGKKVNTIAKSENKSVEEVKQQFCSNSTLQEQYEILDEYVKEHKYKGKRTLKEKGETENKQTEFNMITLDVKSINSIIESVKSDTEKLNEIKKIIDKVIAHNEIAKLKEDIEKQKEQIKEAEKQLEEKINNLSK